MEEESKDKIKIVDLIIGIMVLLIMIILCFLILIFLMPDEYKLRLNCSNCSIGRVEVAGDFKTDKINKNPLNYEDTRFCAIKDCVAYNTYQKSNKSEMRCLV